MASRRGFRILELAGVIPQGPLVSGVKQGWNIAFQTMMQELAPQDAKGSYQRPAYAFDGAIDDAAHPFEPGRYHLYVGNACPWCHRVLLALSILGLSEHITFTWLLDDAERASRGGWVFDPSTGLDPVFGASDLRAVYDRCQPGFTGRCTAPLLVDKVTKRAVCNDSGILLDSLYRLAASRGLSNRDLKPVHLTQQIEEMSDLNYREINNAVYRSGFATSQGGYDAAQDDLEAGLARVEKRLSEHRFLLGDQFTDADLRLFPTVVRYDAVYNGLFKCTRRRISADFPSMQAWMQDVWLLPTTGSLQIKDTFDVDAARRSYYGQLFPLNPGGIVPAGPTAHDLHLGQDAERTGRCTEPFHSVSGRVTPDLASSSA